jgi:hypothetical protein
MYAVSATPTRKTSHATNQEERHPGPRKLIPPPEPVVLPIIGRTPTPIVPRTVSARAIFVQVVIVIALLLCVIARRSCHLSNLALGLGSLGLGSGVDAFHAVRRQRACDNQHP